MGTMPSPPAPGQRRTGLPPFRPDVVVFDLMLPEMPCLDVCLRIRDRDQMTWARRRRLMGPVMTGITKTAVIMNGSQRHRFGHIALTLDPPGGLTLTHPGAATA